MTCPSDYVIYETRVKVEEIVSKYEKLLIETRRYVCKNERDLIREAQVPYTSRKWKGLAEVMKRANNIFLETNKEKQCLLVLEDMEKSGKKITRYSLAKESGVYSNWISQNAKISQRIKQAKITAEASKETRPKLKAVIVPSQEAYERLLAENRAKLAAYARRTMNA
jgi:hypothetical protein